MTYKDWMLVTTKQWNHIIVDYVRSERNQHHEPFCCLTLEEALSYGQICIDRLIHSELKSLTAVQS